MQGGVCGICMTQSSSAALLEIFKVCVNFLFSLLDTPYIVSILCVQLETVAYLFAHQFVLKGGKIILKDLLINMHNQYVIFNGVKCLLYD